MKLSETNPDDRYREIIDMLELRHAPQTSMRFVAPRHHGRRYSFFSLLSRVGRVAAILVVGIAIGLFIVRPDYTIAAGKVLELGLEKIRGSKMCRIDFRARMLPPVPRRPLHLSPKGEMVDVRMVYSSEDGGQSLRFDWTDSSGAHCLEAKSGEKVTLDGVAVEKALPNRVFSDLADILYSEADGFNRVMDSNNVKVKKSDDSITLDMIGKEGEFHATFSDRSGRLTSFKAYDYSGGNNLLMVETTAISYN